MLRLISAIMIAGTLGATAALGAPPVLDEIVIEGNTKTDRSVIERVIGVAPGTPFPLETFDTVWDRLEDCGYFAFVDLDTEEDDQGGVTLLVRVEEDKTFRATPYLRYDRRHKYLLGAALTEINLRGKGEVLEVQAIGYRIQRGHLLWTRPWLFGREGLSLTIDGLWEQGAFVWRPFDYAQWHALAGLRMELDHGFFAELGGGHASFRQKDDYDWRFEDTVVSFASQTRPVWELRARLGLDTRDNPYYPRSGMLHSVQLVTRDGDVIDGQTEVTGDLRVFQQFFGKPIVALRAYGQSLDGVGADEYVLRWGGPETVRGAQYAGREGDTAYLLTAELRWPLFMMPVSQSGETVGLGLHGFLDVGDAWFEDDDSYVGLIETGANRALLSFGAGAHLNLLTWQLRFEAAKERDGDWTFEFMDVFNF